MIASRTGWWYVSFMTVLSLFAEALSLPVETRAELMARLQDSLLEAPEASQHRAAWDAEIASRIEEVEAGKAELVSWEDARAQIFGRGVSK